MDERRLFKFRGEWSAMRPFHAAMRASFPAIIGRKRFAVWEDEITDDLRRLCNKYGISLVEVPRATT